MSDQANEAVDIDDVFANMDSEEQPIEQDDEIDDEVEGKESDEAETEEQDEETEEEAEEEESPEEDEPELYRVTVKNDKGEDEERDLSIEELAAGYMQNADYTRKRGEDAARVREVEQEYSQKIAQTAKQTAEHIEQLKAFVVESIQPELTQLTPELAQQDPSKYVELEARLKHTQNLMAQLDQQSQLVNQERSQIEQTEHQEFLKKCHDYIGEQLPELKDEDYQNRLFQFADSQYGISREEMQWLAAAPQFKDGGYLDSGKMMKLFGDAMSWQKLQDDKPMVRKKVKAAPKLIKPRAPKPKSKHKDDLKRLRGGDVNAADRLLANL